MTKSLSIRRTLNIDEFDLPLMSSDLGLRLLKHKFIIRGDALDECKEQIEEIYRWTRDNVSNHYMVREPMPVDSSDYTSTMSFKTYVYFSDRDEAMTFKLTFPLHVEEQDAEGEF